MTGAPGIVIRKLGEGDLDAFIRIRLEGLRTDPASFGRSYATEKDRPRSDFADYLAPSRWRIVWGAFRGEKLVGLIRLEREGTATQRWIYSMYVAPAERGQGLARRLLKTAILRAKRDPRVRRLCLSVATENAAALALYRSAGFAIRSVDKDVAIIDGRVHSEFRMEKFLRSRPAL